MIPTIAIIVLALTVLAGLALVPLGLPGLWLMVLGVIAYGWMTAFRSVGAVTILVVLGLAFVSEIVDNWLGFRYAKRWGGSSRAGWGALLGGIVGAIVGVPVPLIGSLIGAFAGSFAGAVVFEYTYSRRAGVAVRAGWGSVLGRVAAAAVKMGIGFAIAIIGLVAVIRGWR